jgi:hypothetical protein
MEDVAIAAVFAVTGWMLRTYLTHRERMKELSMAKLGLGASEQRLARVEHAVESIAVEVERIGEGPALRHDAARRARAPRARDRRRGGPPDRHTPLTSRPSYGSCAITRAEAGGLDEPARPALHRRDRRRR